MTNTTQRNIFRIVLWSTVWALALIASAIVLKQNPAKEWVQAFLFIVALTVVLWQGQQLSCRR
jgi:predicted membrane channel-forming protein YqfA (hemolysin III family)